MFFFSPEIIFQSLLKETYLGPRGFGDLGRMAIYFQGAGDTGNYFRGARERAHNFGDLGSLAKKQKNKEKPPFCLIF